MRWVTESKWIEAQVGKVLSFKPRIGKVKTGQTTSRFTVISPFKNEGTFQSESVEEDNITSSVL